MIKLPLSLFFILISMSIKASFFFETKSVLYSSQINIIKKHEFTKDSYAILSQKKESYFKEDIEKIFKYRIAFQPSTLVRHEILEHNKLIYGAEYSIGPFSNRLVPNSPQKCENFTILVGGSNTFGQWLPDEKNVAAFLQNKLNEIGSCNKVYNLSCNGCSLSIIYQLLKSIELDKAIPEKKGILIYPFYLFHVNRDNCLPPAYDWALGELPNLDENLNDLGVCRESMWIRIRNLFTRKYLSLTKGPKISYRDFLDGDKIEQTAKVMSGINKLLQRKIDTSYVLISPFQYSKDRSFFPMVEKKMKKYNIKTVEVKNLSEEDQGKYRFYYDSHLNEVGHRLLSDQIYKLFLTKAE